MISSASADTVWSRLESAIAAGGRVLIGHQREGNRIYPTVIGVPLYVFMYIFVFYIAYVVFHRPLID